MGKFERMLFICGIALLIVLFSVMIAQEKKAGDDAPIYRMTVIIDKQNDDYWRNFEKGADNAAEKYNVVVQYVPLLDGASSGLQEYYLDREIGGSADAVVVAVSDCASLSDWIRDFPPSTPVISLGGELPPDDVDVLIGADDAAMGAALAERMISDGVASCVVFRTANASKAQAGRLDGLLRVLGEGGVVCGVEEVSENTLSKLGGSGAAVGLDASVTALLADRASEGCALYGIGFSNHILSRLESGRVCGLVVQSDFAAGYLCIESAVEALSGGRPQAQIHLEHYSVGRDTMYERPLEPILFPIP